MKTVFGQWTHSALKLLDHGALQVTLRDGNRNWIRTFLTGPTKSPLIPQHMMSILLQ